MLDSLKSAEQDDEHPGPILQDTCHSSVLNEKFRNIMFLRVLFNLEHQAQHSLRWVRQFNSPSRLAPVAKLGRPPTFRSRDLTLAAGA